MTMPVRPRLSSPRLTIASRMVTAAVLLATIAMTGGPAPVSATVATERAVHTEAPAATVTTTRIVTRCSVNARTRPTTAATRKTVIRTGVTVKVAATVTGGRYATTCGGRYVSGSSWYRISAINGRSVRSLYGISYLYAAKGLFRTVTVTTTTPSPTPAPSPTATPAPTTAPTLKTVTVNSIVALKETLLDNSVDVIVVKNGTYHVSPANAARSDSLWIGSAASGGYAFDARTRPVLVRAETRGGVVFDGGGGSGYAGLSFEDGAHHQTWDGFTFANMTANYTGIVEIGGYTPRRAPHHITLRHITIRASCVGRATTADGRTWDHAVYIAHALDPGPHDLVFEDIVVDGRGGLASAFHFYHSEPGAPNASNVTVRRLTVTGTQQALILWDATLRNVTFDGGTITGALARAVRYEPGGESMGPTGATGIVFANLTSTGSGYSGFYSSRGSTPSGATFINTSLR